MAIEETPVIEAKTDEDGNVIGWHKELVEENK